MRQQPSHAGHYLRWTSGVRAPSGPGYFFNAPVIPEPSFISFCKVGVGTD